jgi:hypothetical protein
MSRHPSLILLATACGLGLCLQLHAEVPRQLPLSRYARLWKDSPLTTKPLVQEAVKGPGPLDEWALGGIGEVGGGFLLTLFNRTNPQEKRIIEPNNNLGFEVIQVRRVPDKPRATEVELRYKGQTGWVRYDESLLAIKANAQAQGQPRDPRGRDGRSPNQAPPQVQQSQVQQPQQPQQPQQNGERRSRERTVPTPATPSRR